MRNPHVRYMCYPSVACVGKPTEVTIFPRDISRIFREEKEYELFVMGKSDDLVDYHTKLDYDYPCEVKNGCLVFTHTFESEQEYTVRFREKGTKETKIAMYAVEPDLYELRPLKGDLHTHTYYSDGQDGLAMIASDYREEGFDFFSLTDHNRMYTSKLVPELYKDVQTDLCVIPGEEVHTPGTVLHIVHVGGGESVCNKYIHDGKTFEKQVAEIEKTLENAPQQYRHRMALAKWACDEIHKAGGLAIFAHPYWVSNIYNVSKEFVSLLFDMKIFDAFEVMGGLGYRENNLQAALWIDQLQKGNNIPVVGSSDSHNHDFSKDVFARRFTIAFAKDNTSEAIMEAVKNGYSVAAELPKEGETEVRFYSSSLRLVLFCHFLWDNYFNETWRLCIGEGILMRRYAQGEEVGDILTSLKDTVKNFYEKFYGKVPSPVITPSRREFLDTALDMQRNIGPKTKGSALHLYGTNDRRE